VSGKRGDAGGGAGGGTEGLVVPAPGMITH
jgi:hypothetical protein